MDVVGDVGTASFRTPDPEDLPQYVWKKKAAKSRSQHSTYACRAEIDAREVPGTSTRNLGPESGAKSVSDHKLFEQEHDSKRLLLDVSKRDLQTVDDKSEPEERPVRWSAVSRVSTVGAGQASTDMADLPDEAFHRGDGSDESADSLSPRAPLADVSELEEDADDDKPRADHLTCGSETETVTGGEHSRLDDTFQMHSQKSASEERRDSIQLLEDIPEISEYSDDELEYSRTVSDVTLDNSDESTSDSTLETIRYLEDIEEDESPDDVIGRLTCLAIVHVSADQEDAPYNQDHVTVLVSGVSGDNGSSRGEQQSLLRLGAQKTSVREKAESISVIEEADTIHKRTSPEHIIPHQEAEVGFIRVETGNRNMRSAQAANSSETLRNEQAGGGGFRSSASGLGVPRRWLKLSAHDLDEVFACGQRSVAGADGRVSLSTRHRQGLAGTVHGGGRGADEPAGQRSDRGAIARPRSMATSKEAIGVEAQFTGAGDLAEGPGIKSWKETIGDIDTKCVSLGAQKSLGAQLYGNKQLPGHESMEEEINRFHYDSGMLATSTKQDVGSGNEKHYKVRGAWQKERGGRDRQLLEAAVSTSWIESALGTTSSGGCDNARPVDKAEEPGQVRENDSVKTASVPKKVITGMLSVAEGRRELCSTDSDEADLASEDGDRPGGIPYIDDDASSDDTLTPDIEDRLRDIDHPSSVSLKSIICEDYSETPGERDTSETLCLALPTSAKSDSWSKAREANPRSGAVERIVSAAEPPVPRVPTPCEENTNASPADPQPAARPATVTDPKATHWPKYRDGDRTGQSAITRDPGEALSEGDGTNLPSDDNYCPLHTPAMILSAGDRAGDSNEGVSDDAQETPAATHCPKYRDGDRTGHTPVTRDPGEALLEGDGTNLPSDDNYCPLHTPAMILSAGDRAGDSNEGVSDETPATKSLIENFCPVHTPTLVVSLGEKTVGEPDSPDPGDPTECAGSSNSPDRPPATVAMELVLSTDCKCGTAHWRPEAERTQRSDGSSEAAVTACGCVSSSAVAAAAGSSSTTASVSRCRVTSELTVSIGEDVAALTATANVPGSVTGDVHARATCGGSLHVNQTVTQTRSDGAIPEEADKNVRSVVTQTVECKPHADAGSALKVSLNIGGENASAEKGPCECSSRESEAPPTRDSEAEEEVVVATVKLGYGNTPSGKLCGLRAEPSSFTPPVSADDSDTSVSVCRVSVSVYDGGKERRHCADDTSHRGLHSGLTAHAPEEYTSERANDLTKALTKLTEDKFNFGSLDYENGVDLQSRGEAGRLPVESVADSEVGAEKSTSIGNSGSRIVSTDEDESDCAKDAKGDSVLIERHLSDLYQHEDHHIYDDDSVTEQIYLSEDNYYGIGDNIEYVSVLNNVACFQNQNIANINTREMRQKNKSGSNKEGGDSGTARTLANGGQGRSILKRTGSKKVSKSTASKKKHRVQFNESLNKFFEADYVILIREEEFEGECDNDEVCTCNAEREMVRIDSGNAARGFDLNIPETCTFEPPLEFIDQVTLSPPEGYKDVVHQRSIGTTTAAPQGDESGLKTSCLWGSDCRFGSAWTLNHSEVASGWMEVTTLPGHYHGMRPKDVAIVIRLYEALANDPPNDISRV